MVNYKCFRCGYECYQKGMLLKHLSRKNPCKCKLQEIDNIEILKLNKIDEYNKKLYNILKTSSKKENNICQYCNKKLSNYKNKWRHEKNCKKNKIQENKLLEKILDDNKQLKEQNKELLEILKNFKVNTNIKGNNNNNRTTNNIQINNFDCETINYFTEKLAFQIAKRYPQMIGRFVQHLHFNEEHLILIRV